MLSAPFLGQVLHMWFASDSDVSQKNTDMVNYDKSLVPQNGKHQRFFSLFQKRAPNEIGKLQSKNIDM